MAQPHGGVFMKNTIKVLGNLTRARSAKVPLVIIAIVAVIGFSMMACGDDDGNGNNNDSGGQGVTVTFSIDKVNNRTFTITQEGAVWDSGIENASGIRYFFATDATVTVISDQGATMGPAVSMAFGDNVTRTSDTVLTLTIPSHYSSVSGTVTLIQERLHLTVDVGSSNYNKTNTMVINPAKASITFP